MAKKESVQKRLQKVRPPRVQLTANRMGFIAWHRYTQAHVLACRRGNHARIHTRGGCR